MRSLHLPIAVVAVMAAGPVTAQTPGSVLHLGDVLEIARERNPRLRALTSAAQAAGYREAEASTLPDPTFQVGMMNFGVPDLNTDMAMSMAPSVQVMQRVPFPGKLASRGDIAAKGREMAEASAQEAWWEVRQRAAELFYELYTLDRRTEVMRETLALLDDFQDVAKTMYAAGTGRQADVLRSEVEVARMDGEIRQMEARRTATAARLNALLDRPAFTPVPTPVLDPLPLDVPDSNRLIRWAVESRPGLARARLGVEQAQFRSELAAKQIWPDMTIGVAYGQRNRGPGTERMASAMVGFSLPIHAGSRQHALRDEALALERLAEAELIGWQADVDARVGEMMAQLATSRSLAELFRDEVVPQARATVESAFSSYRVGAVDFMTLVDAQMTVNQYESELFTLLGDYGAAIAVLESAVGRELPRTGPVLAGAR